MSYAGVGLKKKVEMGLARAEADEGAAGLEFGTLEPLARLMEQTPADRLLPLLVDRLKTGTELRQLVASAALANARTFAGQNYIGFHALMALPPAYAMAKELPAERQALPVLK